MEMRKVLEKIEGRNLGALVGGNDDFRIAMLQMAEKNEIPGQSEVINLIAHVLGGDPRVVVAIMAAGKEAGDSIMALTVIAMAAGAMLQEEVMRAE